jgi:hypothetical protein
MGTSSTRRVLAFVLGGLLLLGACRRDPNGPSWDVDLLAPLVNTSLTLGDLLADSLLETGPDGAVTLVYRSDLFAFSLDSFITLADTSFDYGFAIPFGPINFPPGATFFSNNEVTRFDLGDVALRYLELKEGEVELWLKNKVPSAVIGTFSLPGATLDGGPAQLSSTVAAGTPVQPSFASQRRSLAGGIFDLRGPTFNAVNTLATSIVATLDPNGQGATLTPQDSLIARANYIGLKPRYARGYFGTQRVEVEPVENELGLFANVVAGLLDLDDVSLRLRVTNGIGMDLRAFLRRVTAVNSRTGVELDLAHSIFQGPINLSRALDVGAPQPSVYNALLDRTNSNVDQFIENLPDRVRYQLDIDVNPLGDVSSGNDFVYDSSELRASLDLEIPLRVIATDLTLQAFVEPELPGNAENPAVRSATLNVFVTNGFPLSVGIHLDVVNAEDQVIAAVPVEGIAQPGLLGADGLVTAPRTSRISARLDEATTRSLYQTKRLRVRAVLNTADQSQHLRLLDSYRLDLKVTLGANYLVNGE